MTRPKALIFDVDGTLAETEEAHRQAFNATVTAWGLPWHWDMEDYRQLLRTTGGKERIRAFQQTRCLSERRLDDAEVAQMHAEKTARYTAILAERLGPRPDERNIHLITRRDVARAPQYTPRQYGNGGNSRRSG